MTKTPTIGSTKLFFASTIVLAALTLIVGFVVMFNLTNKTKEELKQGILMRAQNAALFVESDQVRALRGDASDLGRPAYIELKEKLVALRAINPDVRFIYIMGYNGTNLFFYVDSENPDSTDYSPPGQEYPEASAEELNGYFSDNSYIIGPYADRWGRWVSAMAPIVDEATGERVGVVGVDLSADEYASQLMYVRGSVMAITVLIAALVLLLGLSFRRSGMHIFSLSRENAILVSTKDELKAMQKQIKLGRWRWTPKSSFVSFDDVMYALTGVPTDRKVTYPYFQSILVPEDRAVLDNALAKANTQGTDAFSVTYKVLRQTDKKIVAIRSSCTIERDGNGGIIAVSGTAQELEPSA